MLRKVFCVIEKEMNNSQKHLVIYLTFGIGEINMVFRIFSSFQTNHAVLH